MPNITMPKMGFDMEEGTIVRWLKKVGDEVKKGEPIAEIETDKVTIEIEAFDSGKLTKIVADEGAVVPVGQPIAVLDGEGEGAPAPQAAAGPETPSAQQGAVASPIGEHMEPVAGRADGAQVKASPVAKRLARENGLDLAQIRGSGPGGRIVKEDIEQALRTGARPAAPQPQPVAPLAAPTQPVPVQQQAPAPQPAPQPAPPPQPGARREPMTRLRQTIARRMVQAKTQIPHFYVSMAIDMTAAMQLRKQLNAMEGVRISVNDMIVKACALALQQFPILNASFAEDGVDYHDYINISIAVATDNGLLAPAVTDVDKKSLGIVANEARELIERTRNGKATPDELGRGTFTVSNLGMYGVDEFIAIINPPQAAIVAVGAAADTPVVKDGQVTIAPIMKATISCDHRVGDGALAAQYMQALKGLLESPMRLLI